LFVVRDSWLVAGSGPKGEGKNLDQIRRRLAEIDRQLDLSPAYYHKQIVTTAPLLFCAVGMMAGIVVQNTLPIPVWVWLIVCAAVVAALLVRGWKQAYASAYLVLVCFVCLGAIRLASFNRPSQNDIRNLVGDEPTLATVRGVIATNPYTNSNEWRFARFTHTDRGSSFYLEITEAEMVTGWAKTAGLVRVRINEPVMDLKAGDCVQMYCWLDRFGNATNPGGFDIAKYMAHRKVFIAASVESRQAIELLDGGDAGLFTRTKAGLRRIAMEALLGGPYPDNQAEKLLLALVLGYRADIDRDTIKAFRQTGLLHFICLSGMNFAMVIGFVWWVCKTAGLLKRGRAVVCMMAAVLFLLVVPENPPAFRAAIMCFAFCGSFIFRRKSNPFNSLALAALVLLLIRPTGLFEAGWQLSFAAVLGILLFCPRFYPILREKTIDHPWFTDFMKARPFLPRIVERPEPYDLFSTSFTAWLSTVGIMLYHFHTIQWLTSIWTVLVSPLIGLVSFLGYLKLIIAFASPSIAAALGAIINVLADLLIHIVKLIAGLNISEILIGKTSDWTIILYYALIVFAAFFNFRRRLIKRAVCTAGTALLIVMVALPGWQRAHSNNLVMTTLDVGHGQAILAQLPGGANILFDAGSLSRSDIGTRVVTPFLRYSGIRKIDAVIISHSDIDHINGIPEVNDNCRIESFYAIDAFSREENPAVVFLKKLIEVNDINEIPTAYGPATIRVLWPSEEIYEDDKISDNDKSTVTMIGYAGRRILICSDIAKFAQGEILHRYPDLKADVLIAPHHGSARTLSQDFISKLEPNVVICSRAAHERGRGIDQNENFRLYYTGRNGAVTVSVNRQGTIEKSTFAGEK